jgi:hypothetical protein
LKVSAFHLKDVACGGWWARGRLGFGQLLPGDMLALGLAFGIALGAGNCAAGQIGSGTGSAAGSGTPPAPASAEPAPPTPSAPASTKPAKPAKPPEPFDACDIKNTGASMVATGGLRAVSVLGVGETTRIAGATAVQSRVCSDFAPINWYDRFVTGPDVMRFSPEQKLRLAVTNIINPFNLGTIVGEAGIEVAANSHTPYGPGIDGWAKLSGTNLTQDMTDQFFGTFLIPSITHTDPHYHRRPDLSIPHRIWHCVDQIVWQRDDNGGHTFNYSQIAAPVFDIGISNLYVPGLETRFSADAERYAVGLATAPIDNFITEFVPSIASHIHTHVVFVQRVINQVAANPP